MCISGNQWIASLPWQLVVWNVWVCPGPDRSVAGLVPCAHVVNGPAGAQENVYNFMKPSPSGPILLIIHVGVLPCFSSQAWVTLCSLSPIPILFESRSSQFLLVHPCQIQPHGSVPPQVQRPASPGQRIPRMCSSPPALALKTLLNIESETRFFKKRFYSRQTFAKSKTCSRACPWCTPSSSDVACCLATAQGGSRRKPCLWMYHFPFLGPLNPSVTHVTQWFLRHAISKPPRSWLCNCQADPRSTLGAEPIEGQCLSVPNSQAVHHARSADVQKRSKK